jgi:tetratricopeptide (TPR) repeat protein
MLMSSEAIFPRDMLSQIPEEGAAPSAPSAAPATGAVARKYPILLLLAALCVYYNSFGGSYFLDDYPWIFNNPNLSNPFFFGVRYVVGWSLSLNYWLDGVNIRGYHAVNFAVHVLAALALYGVVRRTLLLPRWSERVRACASELAFVVALLWVVHPLHTQAVTYVIQRCESLMGLFYLLALYCLIRGATAERGFWWYLGGVVCAALSQGSKEVALTLPVVLLAYDWVFFTPFRQSLRRRWLFYLALWAPVFAHLYIHFASGALTSKDNAISFNYPQFTPFQYALTEAGVLLYYVRLTVWPAPLCLDYLDWPISRSLADSYVPVAIVLAVLTVTLIALVRRSWLGFVGAWFFFILAPTSSILPIQDPIFEHRMYLPLAALVAVGVAGAFWLLERLGRRGTIAPRILYGVGLSLTLAWSFYLGGFTIARNALYCHFTNMTADILASRPGNFRAHETLAQSYLYAGELDVALEHARTSARQKPRYYPAYNTIGLIFLQMGKAKEATDAFRVAVELRPGTEPEIFHMNYGRGLLLKGDLPAAVEQYRIAADLKPLSSVGKVLLSAALRESGQSEEADELLEAAKQVDPECTRRMSNQARAEIFDPKPNAILKREGLLLADAVCRLRGQDAVGLDLLGIAQAANGKFPEAQATCRKGIERAEAAEQLVLARQMRERLELYHAKRPYQEERTPK